MTKNYLAKGGKTFGPFSEEQLRELRSSGAINGYSWIWNASRQAWDSLDPAPAGAPVEAEALDAPSAPKPAPKPARQAPVETYSKLIEAVCHDSHHLVTGMLRSMTDSGCELVSRDEEGPVFNRRAPVVLNLLDPRTGKTMNVRARLSQAARKEGRWTYRLQWDQCPEIIAS